MNEQDIELRREVARRFGLDTSWIKSNTQPQVANRSMVVWEEATRLTVLIRSGNTVHQFFPTVGLAPSIGGGRTFIQTYTAESLTHNNLLTTQPPIASVPTPPNSGTINANFNVFWAQLANTINDLHNVKRVLNALLNDLQTMGLIG